MRRDEGECAEVLASAVARETSIRKPLILALLEMQETGSETVAGDPQLAAELAPRGRTSDAMLRRFILPVARRDWLVDDQSRSHSPTYRDTSSRRHARAKRAHRLHRAAGHG